MLDTGPSSRPGLHPGESILRTLTSNLLICLKISKYPRPLFEHVALPLLPTCRIDANNLIRPNCTLFLFVVGKCNTYLTDRRTVIPSTGRLTINNPLAVAASHSARHL